MHALAWLRTCALTDPFASAALPMPVCQAVASFLLDSLACLPPDAALQLEQLNASSDGHVAVVW